MRLLALDDPRSTAEWVERFSRDEAPGVRLRAATDLRLSPVDAERSLDDPQDRVRAAAAALPRLPAARLARLLRDPATARAAARNPSLPAPVIARTIDRLRAPRFWSAPMRRTASVTSERPRWVRSASQSGSARPTVRRT